MDPVIVPAALSKEMNDKALFIQVINDKKPVKDALFNFSLVSVPVYPRELLITPELRSAPWSRVCSLRS